MKNIIHIVNNTRFAFRYVRRTKFYITFSILATLVSAFNSIFSIIILKVILDALLLKSLNYFIFITISVFLISFLMEILEQYLQKRIIDYKSVYIEKNTNLDIFQAAIDMDIIEYDHTEGYDKIFFNLNQGYLNLLSFIQNLCTLIGRVLSIFAITAIIGNYDIWLLTIIVIFVCLNSIFNIVNAKMNFKKSIALIPCERGISYIKRILYLKQYAAELRIFSIFSKLKEKYREYIADKANITKRYAVYEITIHGIQVVLQLIMQLIILIVLAMKYIVGSIAIGDFMVLYNGMMELNDYIISLIDIFPEFYKNSLYIQELRNMVEVRESKKKGSSIDKIKEISIQNVSFAYDEKIVLSDFSACFKENKRYVIIGKNGAGKSTLLKIISGLYEADKGTILVNENVSISKNELKEHCCVVMQDFQYYAISIAENILMRPYRKEDEATIWELLKEVGLYDRIKKLPEGIHTSITQELDENGTFFSGGELQRIAIARALANMKDIIIFDEPTHSLDATSVKLLNQLILEKSTGRILIYVTHNISEIACFDEIVDLDKM